MSENSIAVAGQVVEVFLPKDNAFAKEMAALAKSQADIATAAAGIAAAVASERYYPSYAAGNAATTAGQYFAVLAAGSYDFYVNGNATPVARMPKLDAAGRLIVDAGGAGGAALINNNFGAVGTSLTALRLSTNGDEGGAYISGGAAGSRFGHNCEYVSGADWVARQPSTSRFEQTGGDHIWYSDNGKTPGLTFTPTERLHLTANGVLQPGADNGQALGASSLRWSVVYAGTGTINTSDGTEKSEIRALNAAEMAAAKRIARDIGIFQFLSAIAEKGEDGARLHCGVIAQDVWAIMADEGLIAPLATGVAPDSRYAFLCWDQWDAVAAIDEVRDDDGNVIVAAQPAHKAGERFGIRADQLALFLVAAQEARLSALEAAA